MRQTSQTKDDAKFRTALENMRYRNCTTDDIEYLHGLSSLSSVKQKLNDDRFRNVSVITAWNAHRDRINELGSRRFALDTGQKLESFYSKDTWPSGARESSNKKTKLSRTTSTSNKLKTHDKHINESLQNVPMGPSTKSNRT